MLKILNKIVDTPLAESDIRRILDNKVKIITYHDLSNYTSIEEVLHPFNSTVILCETKPNYGHWVAIMRSGNHKIEYFDPYGKNIDEYTYMSPYKDPCYLSNLLKDIDYIYNGYDLQGKDYEVKTCGRWVSIRLMTKDIPLKVFIDFFKNKVPPEDEDRFVGALTYMFTNK